MFSLEVIGEGATTKIYRDGNTAVKLYVNTPSDEADNEAARQHFAYNAGLPVPKVYGVRKLNNTEVALDMEYINGKPILQPGMDKNARNEAINILAQLQCKMHKINATGLPTLYDRLRWKINTQERLNSTYKNKLLALLERINGNCNNLCHGDFHPLNVLFDGAKHWIIDWVDSTAGNPLADACRTYLILKQHMNRSAGIYLRAFCKEANVKKYDVLAWLPVIAAARLKENMDDKSRAWLFDVLQDAL
jgi:aminoglycoside phosphotransferase (APT) family kinase protein